MPIEMSGRGVLIEEQSPPFSRIGGAGGGLVFDSRESSAGIRMVEDSGDMYGSRVDGCWRFRGGAEASSTPGCQTPAMKLKLKCDCFGTTGLSSSRQSAFSWRHRFMRPRALRAVWSGSMKSSSPA